MPDRPPPDPGEQDPAERTTSSELDLLRRLFEGPVRRPPGLDAPGAKLGPGGRFLLGRRLGQGGFGTVYEALDQETRAPVALKLLDRLEGEWLYRFKREFRVLAGLVHPNLVTLYELFATTTPWFFSMELLRGSDFRTYVARSGPGPQGTGSWPSDSDELPPGPDRYPRSASHEALLRPALHQLAQGLHFLHQAGWLHRDLKSSNILCTAAGRVVLLDFGLVRDIETEERTTHVLGTPAYISPEQAAGGEVGPPTDWYSLGVLLYEALAGALPFTGPPLDLLQRKQLTDPPHPRALMPGAPQDLSDLCMALLCRDPAGRPDGAEVLRLLQAGGARASANSTTPSTGLLLGRDEALAGLSRAAVAAGQHPVAVLVQGRPGMGKTALCRRFVRQLSEAGRAVALAARCYEHEQVPYKAVDGAMDALSRYLLRLPEAAAAALLPRDTGALCRLFPVLQQVPAVREVPERQFAHPQEQKRAAFQALRELLQRLSDRRQVVVWIDDLQWGDPDSVELLLEVLRPPDPPALLLLLCCRSEDADSPVPAGLTGALGRGAYAGVELRQIEVRELSPQTSLELARALMEMETGAAGAAPDPIRAEALARECAGSPYFLEELLRGGEADDLPTVEQVIEARAARLPAQARALLEVVCVAGQPILRAVAERAASAEGDGPSGGPQALAALRGGRFLRIRQGACGQELVAYHDRVRETVVRLLSAAALRRRHLELAESLEGERGGPRDLERLAYHLCEAGETGRAAGYAAQAAQQAFAALAFDRAARLYEMALSLQGAGETWLLRSQLGEVLAAGGRLRLAGQSYLQAAVEAPAGEAAGLRRRAAAQLLIGGCVEEGLEVLGPTLREVGLPAPRRGVWALAWLLWLRLWLLLRGRGFRERSAAQVPPDQLRRLEVAWEVAVGLRAADLLSAVAYLTRFELLALQVGEARHVVLALGWEGLATSMRGGGGRTSKRLQERVEDLAQRCGPYEQAFVAFTGGVRLLNLGDFARATGPLELGLRTLRERCPQATWERAYYGIYYLMALLWHGELRQVVREAAAQLAEREADESGLMASLARVAASGLAAAAQGRPEEGLEAIERATAGVAVERLPILRVACLLGRSWNLLYLERDQEAQALLQAELPSLVRQGWLRPALSGATLRYQRALTALRVAAGRRDLLGQAARDARWLERRPLGWVAALGAALRAGLARIAGRDRESLLCLERAEEQFGAAGMALHWAAARWRRGEWLGGAAGEVLLHEAGGRLRSEGVEDPARLTGILIPA